MTLRDCLYNTIHRNKKKLTQIAEDIDMAVSYLNRAALPDAEDSETGTGCRFPLKKLIPLIRTTGDFSILDYIEAALGRVAYPLPAPSLGLADVYRLTMTSVSEFGHLMSAVEQAVADGSVSEPEKDRIIKEGHEAIQAIANLLHSLEDRP